MLEIADAALFEAKHDGRNRVYGYRANGRIDAGFSDLFRHTPWQQRAKLADRARARLTGHHGADPGYRAPHCVHRKPDMPMIRHVSEREAYARRTPAEAAATSTWVTVLLVTLASIGFIAAVLWAATDAHWRRHAQRVEAEVVSVGAVHSLTGHPLRAEVGFIDANGEQRYAQASPAFTSMDVQVGQRIPVLYRQTNPAGVRHDDPPWHWQSTLMIASLATLPLLYLHWYRYQARQVALRHAQLQQRGVRVPVESVRSYCVENDGNFSRHTLIAAWRDGAGELHETSGGFYATPPPVSAGKLAVLADPNDPANSIIAPETLPKSTL